LQRIDVAQETIKNFAERRKGDRVALLVFDDDTYYHWPLTTDLKIIERKSQLLNKRSGGGTNFDGPSESSRGMGPLQASINHFKELGQAKTKVLVMVTDGESNISPTRFEELASQMEAMGVKIYVLGIGESWVNNGSMTMDLRRFVDRLGGTVIPVGDAVQMRTAFDTIDKLELSKVELEKSVSYREIYHYFLVLSVALFLLYLGFTALTRETA
jgi:Ca-activated chloride channel homolog